MAKRQNDDPDVEKDDETADVPLEGAPTLTAEKRLHAKDTVTPQTGETTRVLLTGDNRTVITEAYVPTDEFGFRINVDGQFYEHVGEAADSGTWIFAPTR